MHMNKIFLIWVSLMCLYTVQAQDTSWNGYRISYVGKKSISKKMDGNQNAKLLIENISNDAAVPLYFDLFIEGFTAPNAQRNLHGEFGWATFPNGGALKVPKGQQTYAQCWTQGAYESRMDNIPPALGATKTYVVHFLFSENQGALQGPYPKNKSTVLDLPVRISFVNDTIQLYNSGDKSIRLSVSAKSGGDFYMELFTEASAVQQTNIFQSTVAQRGDSSKPYLFDFKLANRNDWFVKIRKQGFKSEFFKIDTSKTVNTISLTEEKLNNSPYTAKLLKSIKTPTGFWRGAVSEETKTFVCIPGQENWASTSSQKTASKVYKIDFDGNIKWEKVVGWEAWGGDMTLDGKYVAVASNGATIPTALNGNRGGDFIAILNGSDGSIYDTIVSGIQSRNVKFSSDGKLLAIGDQSGVFHIYDVVNKKLIQIGTGLTSFGQNRELEWIDNNAALVISTGDGNLRKYTLSSDKKSSTLTWTAYTGGWGFINGLTISKNGKYIGTGTKSKDQTIIDASTGEVLWTKFTGNFDVAFTPDNNRFATFGGYIYQTDNGKFLGHTGRAGVAYFSPDGKYLMQADRVQVNNGTYGDNAVTIMNEIGDKLTDRNGKANYYDSTDLTTSGGEQAQWAYWSEDGTRIIVLSRDMNLTEEVGISIFSLERCAATTPNVTDVTLCVGSVSSPLNVTASSGNIIRWYGTSAVGGTATTTAPSPSTTAAGKTTYYLSQYNDGQKCESERTPLIVNINAVPTKPVISGGINICAGETVTLSSSSSSGNVWYLNGALIADSTRDKLSVKATGNYNVKVVANGCSSPLSDTTKITVNAIPSKPSITGASTVCSGSSLTLASSATSGNQWYLNGTLIKDSTRDKLVVTAAGSFTVKVTLNNCASPLSEANAVSVVTTPAKPTVTRDANGNLVSSATAGNQWFKETTAITGATNTTYKPTEVGNYNVKVSTNGCSSSASDNYYYLSTAVFNNARARSIKIYPNPVSNQLKIEFDKSLASRITIIIYDLNGREVMRRNQVYSGSDFNLTRFIKGPYTIKIIDGSGKLLTQQKIVKE